MYQGQYENRVRIRDFPDEIIRSCLPSPFQNTIKYIVILPEESMRYVEFVLLIEEELLNNPGGLTWVELKERLDLPYKQPCPTWVGRMERENRLSRSRGSGRAYVWTIKAEG
jgi:hypothetical protein